MLISSRYRYNGKPVRRLNDIQIRAISEFKNNLGQGSYEFERYDCECGNPFDNLELIAEKDRYGIRVETRICPDCGLVMTNPRMNQDGYNKFYDTYYRQIYVGEATPTDQFFSDQAEHGKKIWEYIRKACDTSQISSVL